MKPISQIYKSVLDYCLANDGVRGQIQARDRDASIACNGIQITFDGYNGVKTSQLFFRVDFRYGGSAKKPNDDFTILLMVDVSTSPNTTVIVKTTAI